MNQEKIGAFIAMLRREKGYTQREVANMLDLSEKQSRISAAGEAVVKAAKMV